MQRCSAVSRQIEHGASEDKKQSAVWVSELPEGLEGIEAEAAFKKRGRNAMRSRKAKGLRLLPSSRPHRRLSAVGWSRHVFRTSPVSCRASQTTAGGVGVRERRLHDERLFASILPSASFVCQNARRVLPCKHLSTAGLPTWATAASPASTAISSLSRHSRQQIRLRHRAEEMTGVMSRIALRG